MTIYKSTKTKQCYTLRSNSRTGKEQKEPLFHLLILISFFFLHFPSSCSVHKMSLLQKVTKPTSDKQNMTTQQAYHSVDHVERGKTWTCCPSETLRSTFSGTWPVPCRQVCSLKVTFVRLEQHNITILRLRGNTTF